MEKYEYVYEGAEGYFYPGTNVLINKLNIKDDNALTIAEKENLLTADIEAFNGKYENLIKILDKAIIVK